ncbi:MAG: hypothetical protein D6733_04400 [Methanobacteriota archaeon]|nr:MAG: hypothetical protein D6733_04400 [Euryarchaeota archaeon]
MTSWKTALLITAALLTGCLSGPLPEDLPRTQGPTASPAPSIESLTFLPFDAIPPARVEPDFTGLVPEMEGFRTLPFFNPVDVISNDLKVLNHPRRLQILASIIAKTTYVYVEPEKETDTVIYYTIYRMNDSTTAREILEAYKSVWNKRPLNTSSEVQIWIWDGYVDEMTSRVSALDRKAYLYWNPEANASFFSNKVLESHPALTHPSANLYSVHGETAYGPYFIMIDMKTTPQNIQNKSNQIFTAFAEEISKNTAILNETPQTPPTKETARTENKAVEDVKAKMKALLESYLAEEITKEEYDRLFQQYETELKNLTNATQQNS